MQNDSGDTLLKNEAVVASAPVVIPDSGDDTAPETLEFTNRIVLKVDVPADGDQGRWLVLLDDLEDQRIGRAAAMGVVQCWINLNDVSDAYAEIVDGDQVPSSAKQGFARIIWVNGGVGTADATGFQWAIIYLGAPAEAGFWIKITSSTLISGASNRWTYGWTEQAVNKLGAYQDRPAGRTSASTSWPAYNSIEANNGDSGVQGNSIDLADLPEGVNIQPVKGSPVVWARVETNCDGGIELYFSYENAVNPHCDDEET